MKHRRTFLFFLLVVGLFDTGCVAEQGIDKRKFAPALRTARELQTSLTKSPPCDIPEAMLRSLVAETEALKTMTASPAEKKVVLALSGLITTYQDGALLCGARGRMSDFTFVPKGRIHVFQDLEPVIRKYDLPIERHVYAPTGAAWKSISVDSIGVIWENAESRLRDIENMVNYS